MKLSSALSLSVFSTPLSIVLTNAQDTANIAAEYKRISQLRGADLSSSPIRLGSASSWSGLGTPRAVVQGSDQDALATCTALKDSKNCDANDACTWCLAGAVPSECVPVSLAGGLPAGVFQCSKAVTGHSSSASVTSAKAEEKAEKKKSVSKVHTFNLKEGITLTLETAEVDKEFCDASSPLSLAGYMNVKGSQFDSRNDKNLFYWFFEKRSTSQINKDPSVESVSVADANTPLVIWLTGGPGCSSSLALLTENGPCSVNQDAKTTSVNPYSWIESAHVLWLDQPADVGYSYGQENDSNEEMISEDAYYFIQAFLKSDMGSKYKENPLYIVGESYGGHYAPAIAHRIWRGNKDLKDGLAKLNLKGLAVGNGLTDPEEQYKWYAEMAYNNSHGIKVISEQTYKTMKSAEPFCTKGIHECNSGDGMLASFACQGAFVGCNTALTSPYRMTGLNPYDIRKECGDNPLCYDFSHVTTFMNLDSTKEALHVAEHNPTWQTCNMLVNMEFHTDWMKDFSPYVADLLNDGIPALIYAGDVDFICNYLGNRAWTLGLDWNHSKEFQAAEEKDWNDGKGLSRSANGFTFLQVYDAGHMVPTDQPEVALKMITQFLNGEAF